MPTFNAFRSLRYTTLAFFLPMLFGGVAAAQTARLVKYRADVSFASAHSAAVVVSFDLQNKGKEAPMSVRLFHYPGQQVESGLLKNSAQQFSAAVFREEQDWSGAKLENASETIPEHSRASYEVTYTVSSDSLLRRVPLPFPDAIPISRQLPVTLDVTLPVGYVLAGDSFPLLTFGASNHGSTRLLAVPTLLQIQSAPANEISIDDRLFNPAALTTIAMLLLLASGSIVWYWRSRLA